MKNSPAFTLIEVILAMGVLTSTIFIISNLMMRSFLRVEECRDDIEKIFLIKRELYANYFRPPKEGKKVVQKIEEPQITITSVLDEIKNKKVDSNSFVSVLSDDVVFEKNSDCVISELSGTRCESCAGGRCEYLDKLNEN